MPPPVGGGIVVSMKHVKYAALTWTVMVLAAILILASGTAKHRTVVQTIQPEHTCVSQTMEVVPCQ